MGQLNKSKLNKNTGSTAIFAKLSLALQIMTSVETTNDAFQKCNATCNSRYET